MLIAKLINGPLMRLIAHTMRGSSGGGGDRVSGTLLKNQSNIGFLSNTDPDSLKNHIGTKPAFNVGPSLTYCCPADDGPLIMVYGSYHQLKKGGTPSENKKNVVKVGDPLTKLSGSAHAG